MHCENENVVLLQRILQQNMPEYPDYVTVS